jgi:hypothetical protein
MKVIKHQGGDRVQLSRPFDNRTKVLNFVYFLVFAVSGSAFILLISDTAGNSSDLVGLVIGALFCFIGYKFLNKAFMSEELDIANGRLIIRRKGFLRSKEDVFEISGISNFRHLAMPELTKHNLAGDSFDYLGFQTEQKLINDLHGDNRVGFDYEGKFVSFGEEIYSWEFEQLEILLYDLTGNDLRYDDNTEAERFGNVD